MKVIGLCGSSGSGKGYVCNKIKKLGIICIDTDKVYADLIKPGSKCLYEINSSLGNDLILENGELDRKKLAKRVFEDENAKDNLAILNSISHRYVLAETKKIIREARENGDRAIVVDAPALFESGFDAMCDITVCVTASKEMRISRIIKRDGITREKAIARLDSQIPDEKLRSLCDYEIVNDVDPDLDSAISEIFGGIGV